MNNAKIEKEARRLQFEIWQKRALLFPLGVPPPQLMFQPTIAAHVLDLEYEQRPQIISGVAGFESAGMLDRQHRIISISSHFKHDVQRFTGGHEIGHYLLHPHLGSGVIHRDRPIYAMGLAGRPPIEQEADYFSACFLAPRRLVIEEFNKRFGPEPLWLDETLAFHLCGNSSSDLFTEPRALKFAAAVAGATKLDRHHFPSLAQQFDMSVSAMAIRLQELELVRD